MPMGVAGLCESGSCNSRAAGEKPTSAADRPMPAIPPSLEDLSLELLVNNVQAYAEANSKEEALPMREGEPSSRHHPFFHPPPYERDEDTITDSPMPVISESSSQPDSSPTPMETEEVEETPPLPDHRPLPSCIGNKLLVAVKDRGILGPATLALFRKPFVRLTEADLSETGELREDDVEMLSEHNLESLELRGMEKLDLCRVLTTCLSPSTQVRLRLLDMSYSMPKGQEVKEATAGAAGPGPSASRRKHFTANLSLGALGRRAGRREPGSSGDGPSEEDEAAKSAVPATIRNALLSLQALQTLKLAGTCLDNLALRQLVPHLPALHTLDISATAVTDLKPLSPLWNQLRNLILFNTPIVPVNVSVLLTLQALEVLDIADGSNNTNDPRVFLGKQFLLDAEEMWKSESQIACPLLRILDMSGLHGNVEGSILTAFLRNHPQLQFLGLIRNPLRNCFDELREFPNLLKSSDLKVAGDLSLAQILVGLRAARGVTEGWRGGTRGGCRWREREALLSAQLHAAFAELHQNYEGIQEGELRELLGLVLAGMGGLVSSVGIQMAATACLYNLCRSHRAGSFPNHLLGQVVTRCLDALHFHPNVSQLAKNVWLTLCNDQILQTGQFDLYRCCHLALESMVTHPNEAAITRMTVAIVSILAAKIPIERTTTLGANARYMEFMLGIVQGKLEEHYANLQHLPPGSQPPSPDVTLKFTLSALWNLTDESPGTSEQFLQHDGLDVVLQVLQTYSDEPSIQTKILGLLNNVAEVERLKERLAGHAVLRAIVDLLKSEKIEVSYFAAGILAHLCVGNPWETRPSWKEALEALESRIRDWGRPDNEMVAYRSFRPFFPLLCRDDLPGVQLWAVWAVRHVCGKSESRYLPLFLEEDGDKAVMAILVKARHRLAQESDAPDGEAEEESTQALILSLCDEIMNRIQLHRRRSRSRSASRSASPASPRPPVPDHLLI